jgi:hypothetical protein
LNQWSTPQLRLQIWDYCTFLIVCDASSTSFFVENLLNVLQVLFSGFLVL